MTAPYRDDHDALTARLGTLLEELDAARARAAELRSLDLGEADLQKQIEAVRGRLDRAAKRRLALLDNVRVASPCPADWDAMTGDERTRHCAQCDKDVHNLSAMSREDAEAFLRGLTGSGACIRLYRRADGTVLTADCPVGARRTRRRRAAASLVGGGLLAAGSLLATARSRASLAEAPVVGCPTATATAVETAPTEVMGEPTAQPREGWTGGAAPMVTMTPAEAMRGHVQYLLGQRAEAKDPATRRGLEDQIRTAQRQLDALEHPRATTKPLPRGKGGSR